MDESGQKKIIRILLIVIGVLAVILALLCGCIVLGNTVLQHDQEETEEEDDEDDADEDGEDDDEEDDEDGEDDEDEESDASELLMKYYEKLLEDSEHPIDYYKQYHIPYEETEDGYAGAGYIKEIDGPVAYDIRDYDQDGEEELLVLGFVENSNSDGPENILEWQMYETEDGEVKLQDSLQTCQRSFGGFDSQTAEYYIKQDGDHTYIAENLHEFVCLLADGGNYELRVLHYDGESFEEDFYKGFYGSDFAETEEEVAQAASDLERLGFPNTAANLTETLEIQQEDGMEAFFLAKGENREIYNPESETYKYWDTYDISILGEITYEFFHAVDESQAKNGITGYTTQTDDFSASGNGRTVNAFFERIIFEDRNMPEISWLNSQIEQMESCYQDQVSDIDEELEMLLDYPYDDDWNYSPYSVESVYYDKDGNVSVGYIYDWYMGGVHNEGWDSLNCNIYSRDHLELKDIFGVDVETARERLNQALINEGVPESNLEGIDTLSCATFYFDQDTVTACFDSYALDLGNCSLQVKVPRN